MRPLLCACAFLCACQRDFAVPEPKPPPAPPTVGVTGFSPAEGWAGQRVTITGHDLGSPTETEVRFGQSSRVSPLSVAPDGKSLDVRVPDDVAQGLVVVSVATPLGQASAPGQFNFKGLGRLRQGAVTQSLDLRVSPTALVAENPGAYTVLVRDSHWAGHFDSYWQSREVHGPVAVAWAAAASTEMLLSTATSGCASAAGKLFAGSSEVCLPGTPPDDTGSWALATDDLGTHVVASVEAQLWTVDLSSADPVVTPIAIAGNAFLAWAGSDHFLVFDGNGVRPLAFSAVPQLGDALTTPSYVGVDGLAIAASVGKGVAAYCQGDPGLLDISVWPPQPIAGAPAPGARSDYCYDIALSPDARTLLRMGPSNVTLLDVSQPVWLPIAAPELESPGGLAVTDSAFLVTVKGGVLALSLGTAESVSFRALKSGAGLPVIRNASTGSKVEQVIELPLRTVNALLRVSPETFYPGGFPDAPSYSRQAPLDPANVLQIATDGTHLWTLHEDTEVRRLVDVPGALPYEDPAGRWQPADYDTFSSRDLAVAPGGAAVLLHWNAGSLIFGSDWRVAFLDPAKTWDSNYAPATLSVEQEISPSDPFVFSAGLVSDGETSWLVDRLHVRQLDIAATLQGADAGTGTAFDTANDGAAAAQGALFVLEDQENGSGISLGVPRTLLRLDKAGAQSQVAPPLYQEAEAGNFVLSVSGRRIYFIRGPQGSAQRRLVAAAFDPETGITGAEDPPIPLPPNALELVQFPDGEKMLVLDSDSDRLLLVE